MLTIAEQLDQALALNQVTIPDVWQQDAVIALRAGQDVVVHAPTGAGKTFIFELWSKQGKNHGQAIYTVPTRALANDKLAEWRARGWNVGIATGDLAENLHAPILVATLETQKNRLIRGEGPSLLVVDEYQMLGDPDRGLNYELALALAPPKTQLLLLSGSVANPQDVVKWLVRLGRKAVLVRYDTRPVPLDEVHATQMHYRLPNEVKGYWSRLAARALAENLGPILIFAPRRQAAEAIARELARQLPCPNPLQLTPEQKQLVGDSLAQILKTQVTYHHSGLSYAARAGVVEPLAKAGQLRVVVATMGLAAGINFSLRSVALAGDSYRRGELEQPLAANEILQMFGRAGRRGIDEVGYVIITENGLSLREAYSTHLARSAMVDWNALLGVMAVAAEQGRDPFAEAVRVQQRLFTTKPVHLGVEESLKNPVTPCGLKTDAERARHVRKLVRQFQNSHGEWQNMPAPVETKLKDIWMVEDSPYGVPASAGRNPIVESAENVPSHRGNTSPSRLKAGLHTVENFVRVGSDAQGKMEPGVVPATPHPPPHLRSILSNPAALEKFGQGALCVLEQTHGKPTLYGRSVTVAELLNGDQVLLVKWIRRLTNWSGRQTTRQTWLDNVVPLLARKLAEQRTPLVRIEEHSGKLIALLSLGEMTMKVPVDAHGVALWKAPERQVLAEDCARCPLVETCRQLSVATGVALLWRRMGLVDAKGKPTRRGLITSYFSQSHGLAIAAAIEDENYPLEELIYDLSNLEAGFRFCGDENRWGGRLAQACQRAYGIQSIPGYLENGSPPDYGAGAEQIVAAVHKSPSNKFIWVREFLGVGDIDRVIIEWRSLMRQISHTPPMDWQRWQKFQALAKSILNETESPTLTDLPPLEYSQTKRIDHRLILRRH